MGYTHYWDIRGWDSLQWQVAWPKLIEDIRRILKATDVPVSGGSDETDVDTPPVADAEKGIIFNGVESDSHERFELGRENSSYFCKTLRKPYDVVVACVLLRAYMLAPSNVRVGSDGNWKEVQWEEARDLYKSVWPKEVIWCPWKGPPRDENGRYIGDDGVAHFGVWTMRFDLNGEYRGPEEWLVTPDGKQLTPKEMLHTKATETLDGGTNEADIVGLAERMNQGFTLGSSPLSRGA